MDENGYVAKKYIKFAEEKGYIPLIFNLYNCKDLAGGGSTYCDYSMRKHHVKCDSFNIRRKENTCNGKRVTTRT